MEGKNGGGQIYTHGGSKRSSSWFERRELGRVELGNIPKASPKGKKLKDAGGTGHGDIVSWEEESQFWKVYYMTGRDGENWC